MSGHENKRRWKFDFEIIPQDKLFEAIQSSDLAEDYELTGSAIWEIVSAIVELRAENLTNDLSRGSHGATRDGATDIGKATQALLDALQANFRSSHIFQGLLENLPDITPERANTVWEQMLGGPSHSDLVAAWDEFAESSQTDESASLPDSPGPRIITLLILLRNLNDAAARLASNGYTGDALETYGRGRSPSNLPKLVRRICEILGPFIAADDIRSGVLAEAVHELLISEPVASVIKNKKVPSIRRIQNIISESQE